MLLNTDWFRMNSVSRYKTRGSILLMALVITASMTTLALAGLQRTHYQSQLAASLTRQASLQAETRRVLAVAAREVAGGGPAQTFTPGCPPQCDWQAARHTTAAEGVTAAYIAQLIAPGSKRFMLVARAVHDGGEVHSHALFDADSNAFHFVQ